MKISAKQACTVVLAPEGVELHWADDSKSLRSSLQLRSELFSSYECGAPKRVFGVAFLQLVDTLSVFASASSSAPLQLHYPGPDGELQLELCDGGDAVDVDGGAAQGVMYARIATMEQGLPCDMTDYWQEPASYFLLRGALLKEAVEDLEWPGGCVAVRLARDPARISMAARGTGSLEIHLNAADLSGFQVADSEVQQRYRYKNLKAAMCHIPDGRDVGGAVSTKVSIDANGLLKVTHMVPLAGGKGPGGSAGPQPSLQPSALSGFAATQAALGSSRDEQEEHHLCGRRRRRRSSSSSSVLSQQQQQQQEPRQHLA
ncbi:hypothetical protein COO60DRAFT_1700427 [Scenedesmus sp. NREL 46B-D3]|nr:hypothetical protein COO60DRAFT_1700427 [Scenedesmus sp. NREL 46B-D3]